MRWCYAVAWVVLFASTLAQSAETAAKSENVTAVCAAVSASALGGAHSALALRHLAALVLRAAGVNATAADSPPACEPPDAPACLKQVLNALTAGKVTVALVTVPAGEAPPAWQLRENGIEELGDAAPPARRACLASRPPARSLLDLADPALALHYHVPDQEIRTLLKHVGADESTCSSNCTSDAFTPEWCSTGKASCATLLTSSESEARVLLGVVRARSLHATVRALGARLATIAASLSTRPLIVCDWAPEATPLADFNPNPLGPPPCSSTEPCPFETRRLVKFVNVREMARAPSAIRALVGLTLSTTEMRELGAAAQAHGPEAAAQEFLKARPAIRRPGEVRVAVLLPQSTDREAYSGLALAAAAALAEDDLTAATVRFNFKVEVYDDGCHTARAYKYLSDALGTAEYGSLSALAGPACGAPWADVARQSWAHRLPVLAYTLQAPAEGSAVPEAETRLQLLAAGDAREASGALATLVARMGWRRLAVLSERATRPLLDAVRARAKLEVHVELADEGPVPADVIDNWVEQVSKANARVIYLCVEDARVARAALCAARAAGLTPSAGTVWLFCSTQSPPSRWLRAGHGDNCTQEQLDEVAAGYLAVTPDWRSAWQEETNVSSVRREWETRWRAHCRHLTSPSSAAGARDACAAPGPHAALLYDLVRLWAAALNRLLLKHPDAIDDLHDLRYIRSLIEDATTTEFTGLTGPFQWAAADGGAYARVVPFVLSQWDKTGGRRAVGRWSQGELEVEMEALRWQTADGRLPDDGGERCALQGLADALHADCRSAFVALGVLLVALLVLALAAVALHCRRRAEREYRARLAALGMRPLAAKPIGFDRWEIPRERVVINRKLGTGAFGTVYGGHALLAEDRDWSAVAVKTLKAGATTEEKLDFLSEAEAMKRFDHKNVVRLLGVVTKTEPVCTVMEFMLYGDLKNYLLARRHLATGAGAGDEEAGGEADEASPRRLTGMALDVARALSYLAQLRYVHRDVAARNCLMSARRVVKLADFGMTRLVFENDYYRFSRKGMLPVRWMAPESLALGVFSPASDVWSFGVLLYEIVTFGSLPFQGLSNSEVLARVKGGHTLDLPPGIRPQLEGLIKSCWQQDSKKRPSASEVAAYLADAPRLLAPCLDVPLDALPLDADPPWRLPRDQAEARWVSWAAPASAATDTTYLSTDGALPLDTDSFLT